MLKRPFDICFAILAIMLLFVPAIVVGLCVRATSPGPALYWSQRVGRDGQLFAMPKFRTMQLNTPELATDELTYPDQYITPIGAFLRRSSLDELPQLYSIMRGNMSVVGPRPALHNQFDLIKLRSNLGIDALRPGLTGWAQINGRDEIDMKRKLQLDEEYLTRHSLFFDLKIIALTIIVLFRNKGFAD